MSLIYVYNVTDWVSCYTELASFCLELFLFWSVHSISFWIVHLYVGSIMHPNQDIWDLIWMISWNWHQLISVPLHSLELSRISLNFRMNNTTYKLRWREVPVRLHLTSNKSYLKGPVLGGGRLLPNKRLIGMCCWMACIFTTGCTIY